MTLVVWMVRFEKGKRRILQSFLFVFIRFIFMCRADFQNPLLPFFFRCRLADGFSDLVSFCPFDFVIPAVRDGASCIRIIFCFCFLFALIFQSIHDKKEYRVRKGWNRFLFGLGFLRPIVLQETFAVPVTGVLLGGGVCMLVYILCRGRGFGGGDVKFAAAGGAMLGGDILYALLLACGCAVFVRCCSVDYGEKKHGRQFAFIPYMALGMEVILLIRIWG